VRYYLSGIAGVQQQEQPGSARGLLVLPVKPLDLRLLEPPPLTHQRTSDHDIPRKTTRLELKPAFLERHDQAVHSMI
jgi:hypothetical protein